MANRWLEEAKERLLPLSREQNIFEEAVKEWVWTYDLIDLYPNRDFFDDDDDPEFVEGVEYNNGYAYCGLCGKERLRYVYLIKNTYIANYLYVGSKCIEKFDIASQIGNKGKERNNELKESKKQHIQVAAQKYVVECLEQIIDDEDREKIQSFIDYFETYGAFTPMQMIVIVRKLEKNKIRYNPRFFKIKMRRNREKEQFIKIGITQSQKYLFPVMTKAQIGTVNNIFLQELEKLDNLFN